MTRLRVGPDFAVFVLFFGVALIDALRHGEWLMPIVYVVLGLLFLRAGARVTANGRAPVSENTLA